MSNVRASAPEYETHYQIKCRMSVGENYHVRGYARTKDDLDELLEHLKKTWRYVEVYPYLSRVYIETKDKPKRKVNK